MKKIAVVTVVVLFCVTPVPFATSADLRPETIEIKTIQKKKPVVFEHGEHQETVGDCQVCHHRAENDLVTQPFSGCHKIKTSDGTPEFIDAMHGSCID